MKMRHALHLITVAAVLALWPAVAGAVKVGDTIQSPELRDATDAPTTIPDFGVKLLAIFYNDADEADMNDPLADAIKAKKFDEANYRGIGVANLADSKAPNFLIRKIIRGKIEKYKSTILTDPDHKLSTAWELGDCNNVSVFVLVGKDKQVKHIQRGPIRGADIDAILHTMTALLEPAPAAAPAAAPAQ
jgi:hypothetical protein